MKARFKGRMLLTDIDAPHTYTIVFEGQGGVAGFGKGRRARHARTRRRRRATRLTYTASAQVGGKLAQIGSRLVDGAARKIAGEFFKRFSAQVTGETRRDAEAARSLRQPATTQHRIDGADAESGDDQTKRKKSWTAWISKS